MVKLDLDPARPELPARDAATLVVVRDAPAGVEVFCVGRHPKSGFLGGAIVFPGGKVDPHDASPEWEGVIDGGEVEREDRALRVAACREALEEAAILPVTGGRVSHQELVELRATLVAAGPGRAPALLVAFLRARALRLDLDALRPLARWVTPVAEARRYDTRFYVVPLPEGQSGAHDDHELTSSFWAHPADVIARWESGDVMLAPPTHRTLEVLAAARTTADVLAVAHAACLDPICPRLVSEGGTVALVLPGDPRHDVTEARVPGRSRYVLRGERFVPEDPPAP